MPNGDEIMFKKLRELKDLGISKWALEKQFLLPYEIYIISKRFKISEKETVELTREYLNTERKRYV
jgi:hypothetical protein